MLHQANCLDVLPEIEDKSVDLVLTDPPYEIEDMREYFSHFVRVLKDTGSIYVFGDKRMIAEHWYSQLRVPHKDFLVWHYKNSPKPKGRWRMSMQSIIYGYKSADSYFDQDAARIPYLESTLKLHGRVRPSSGRMSSASPYDTSKGALPRDVIECPALLGHLSKERLGHRDQKPIALIEKLMKVSSRPGDMVLDAFMGSGTTIEAAINTDRRYVGIEMNAGNFEMASSRAERAMKNRSLPLPNEI